MFQNKKDQVTPQLQLWSHLIFFILKHTEGGAVVYVKITLFKQNIIIILHRGLAERRHLSLQNKFGMTKIK